MPRPEVMHHLLAGENVALITLRQQSRDAEWRNVGITNTLAESSVISNYTREIGYVFPLYRYPDTKGEQGALMPEVGRTANLSAAFLEALAGAVGHAPTPKAVLGYLYAVLHSPTYRARYAEFLKRDFPRVPLPPNKKTFNMLALLGGALIDLHLLRHHELKTPSCKYPVPGDNRIECIEYDEKAQRVWIKAAQYFEPVPPEVWAYRVGGYQVCHKWLDDRKGTKLSLEERLTFQKMITALESTLELQKKLTQLCGGHGAGEVILLLFGQVLTLPEEKDGQGEELGQGGLLMPLLRGELEPLGLQGLELVSKLRAHARDPPRRRWPREGFLRQDGKGGAHDLAAWHPLFFYIPGVGVK
jgi:hypothetical protein